MKERHLIIALCLGLVAALAMSIPVVSGDQASFSETAAQVDIQISGTSGTGSCGQPIDNGGFSTIVNCTDGYPSPGQIMFTVSAPAVQNAGGTVSKLEVRVEGIYSSSNTQTLSDQSINAAAGELSITNSTTLPTDFVAAQIIIDYNAICSADLSSCVQDTADASHIDIALTGSSTQSTQPGGITLPSLPSIPGIPSDPVSVGVATAAISSIGVLAIMGSGPIGDGEGSPDSSGLGEEPPDPGQRLDTLDGGATFEQTYHWLTDKGFNPDMVNVGGQLYFVPISGNDPAGHRIGYAFETTQVVDPVSGSVVEVINPAYPIQAILPPGWNPPTREVPQPPQPVDTNQPVPPPSPQDDTAVTTPPVVDQPASEPPAATDTTVPSKPAPPQSPSGEQPAPWHGPDGPGPYRLTLYVDDSDVVGHTYVSLTDRQGRRVTKGVFDAAVGGTEGSAASATDDAASFVGWHKASMRDDGGHGWSVRRTYVIDEDGYNNAMDYVDMHGQLCAEGKVNYGAFGHRLGVANAENCNIFAKNTMKEAGLQMPESWGLERPHNVAEALRPVPGTEQNATEGGYGTDGSHHAAMLRAAREAQNAAGANDPGTGA